MSIPFPVALLFFLVGLFILMPFLVDLCVCTFSGCSVVLSNRSIGACQWVCAFYNWSIVLSIRSVCVIYPLQWDFILSVGFFYICSSFYGKSVLFSNGSVCFLDR